MINTDGSFNLMKQKDREALVLLSETLGVPSSLHHIVSSPHVLNDASAEAAALRDGLLLVQQIGCNCGEIQSDCMCKENGP